jgi:NAD(P)-dependent dehydrogenase (short-subunit alcohol dehydrogenase family)
LGLDGRVAIVTGGAQGIGRAYCLGLAGEGATVMVADLQDASPVVEEISTQGGRVAAVRVDVSDGESTKEMARATVERFGRIDVLVNNAGFFMQIKRGPWDQISEDEWDKVFAVNVRGVWLCCRAVFPYMKEQGYGKIVNIASNTVWRGVPGFLHYVASKSAILGLTRALAREVGEHNIAVNTVAPEYIPHDPEYAKQYPHIDEMVIAQRCFKRTQTPEDMVGTILYLAGPGSDFVTGQSFLVNGGSSFQ